ncbi:MAG: methyltransferase domain-containing protein, partial [archaeon]
GNIAIVNFPKGYKAKDKKKFADKIIKDNKAIKTVLEKKGKIKGRLRKLTTRYIVGEKTKEVLYRENGCVFRFNIDSTYFSPRLSNERKEIASKIKKGNDVLVMFAGVAPFSIVIAKHSGARVVSNEINREANKYAKLNIELNNLKNRVELVPGDIKKVIKKFGRGKFDVIVMPRPQLKDTFLKEAFKLSKKGTKIFYYDFAKVGDEKLIVEKIKKEAKQSRKQIRVLKVKKAGEIAPYKIRVRVDLIII